MMPPQPFFKYNIGFDATESDGFERVTRRRTRDDRPRGDKDIPAHIIGSRPANAGNGRCAAVRHGHGGNRSGGLFVSSLSPNTSASTVRRHILKTVVVLT